jgi:hypothetical protein
LKARDFEFSLSSSSSSDDEEELFELPELESALVFFFFGDKEAS